ncbi:MAG: hypothetical protein GWN71_20755, partial [Gammaproteobacteria bacterium]|nr:hypothetical protein [Gemmatimonadota bacterium]NIU75905.1 hypothetical protein [Gammaproteobacteria bacterium]
VFRADTPLASVRATLAVRRAEELVTVLDHAPPLDESFRGELVLFLGPVSDPAALEEALYGVGDVEAVVVESVDADIYRTE